MSDAASGYAAPASRRPELADILAGEGSVYLHHHPSTPSQRKVMRRIVACRTAALGGHRQWCTACGYQRFVYHSCRDRHCPKCQVQAKEAWREARRLELLPTPYFHQVFTLPHELNAWVLQSQANQRALLSLLFEAASATLLEFGRRELGGQVGFTLVLHTWDQQLRPHFHLHGLIAAGALAGGATDCGNLRWVAGGKQFLFPVRALSKMFRGKFLAGFQRLAADNRLALPKDFAGHPSRVRQLLRKLSRKGWVVYSKAPFAGAAKLLDYLSRYTHRVAVSNDRLLAYSASGEDGGREVAFTYRDRRDGNRRKIAKLPAAEFVRRFLLHVLPDRFMRIRHYGFLANRHKSAKLAEIRALLGAQPPPDVPASQTAEQWLQEVLGIDPTSCPCCGGPLCKLPLTPQPLSNVLLTPSLALPRAPPQATQP